jgi:pentatricopeptide repeat protein
MNHDSIHESGLSDHGRCREAIELFGRMQDRGVRPNEITFICVLGACARAGSGLVGATKEIFRTMPTVHGVEPEVAHYGGMVDVLGHAGLLAVAVGLIGRRRPQSALGLFGCQGISNRATQTDALGRPFWAVWVAERTPGQRPASACPFGSHAAPNARTHRICN